MKNSRRSDGSQRVFVYVTTGALEGEGEQIHPQDQARIDPEGPLRLTAASDASFLLIDMPSCRGWGYDEATLRGESAS